MTPIYGQFLYVDRLSLVGVLERAGARHLTINQYTRLLLRPSRFLVLLALFSHSLGKRGHEVPIPFAIGIDYLSGKQIVEAVQGYLCSLQNGPEILVNAGELEIARIVSDLRAMLRSKEMNPFLIKNGSNRKGYRLEVPPEHLQLHYVDPDTNRVYAINWDNERPQ